MSLKKNNYLSLRHYCNFVYTTTTYFDMKKISYLLILVATFLGLSSCGKQSGAYKNLEKKYDSLELISKTSEQNLEEMLSIINEVEQSFDEIRDAEKFVAIKQRSGDLTASTREEIKNNMQLVAQTLKENREKLEQLNSQLSKNSAIAKQLNKKIQRMTRELDTKEAELITLRNELAMKDIRIEKLDSALVQSAQNIDALASENATQQQQIEEQDKELNAVYYCFGTASELKEHKILLGGSIFAAPKVLPEGFNKDYFIRIDRRELRSIPLFDKRAEVRTKHPEGSYELVKGADGNLTLNILNVEEFWSISKYLVVEIK